MLCPYGCRFLRPPARKDVAEQHAAEQTRLFALANGGPVIERVVTHGLDGVEDGDAAAAEHFEVNAQASIHHFRERIALRKKLARPGD